MSELGTFAVVGIILCIIIYGLIHKTDIYSSFAEGVKGGVADVWSVFASLFALFIAVGVMRASGLTDFLASLLRPVTDFLHIPSELLPFAILRPVSGSGSLALASDIFAVHGPDSFLGRCVSVIMGSTETTFYTTSVYFAATGTKNIRHTLKCALIADGFSMVTGFLVCIWWYGL